jgi:hypothetical protein
LGINTPLTEATAEFCFAPPAYRKTVVAKNNRVITTLTLAGFLLAIGILQWISLRTIYSLGRGTKEGQTPTLKILI